jgi:hypothetical protein
VRERFVLGRRANQRVDQRRAGGGRAGAQELDRRRRGDQEPALGVEQQEAAVERAAELAGERSEIAAPDPIRHAERGQGAVEGAHQERELVAFVRALRSRQRAGARQERLVRADERAEEERHHERRGDRGDDDERSQQRQAAPLRGERRGGQVEAQEATLLRRAVAANQKRRERDHGVPAHALGTERVGCGRQGGEDRGGADVAAGRVAERLERLTGVVENRDRGARRQRAQVALEPARTSLGERLGDPLGGGPRLGFALDGEALDRPAIRGEGGEAETGEEQQRERQDERRFAPESATGPRRVSFHDRPFTPGRSRQLAEIERAERAAGEQGDHAADGEEDAERQLRAHVDAADRDQR